MFDANPNTPFVERLTGISATLFAVKFCSKMSTLPMQSEVWLNTKMHWSPAALEQRAKNRQIYLDAKYPERPSIVLPGDKEWPN